MTIKKNILVTGTGGRSVGSGILHALLRSSPEVTKRWNVVSSDAMGFAWGLYKTRDSVLLPMAGDATYIDQLTRVLDRYRIDALVPGTQQEIDVISKNLDNIRNTTVIINDKRLIPLMMDKYVLQEKLRDLCLPQIDTRPVSEWEKVAGQYGYPLIVKPTADTGGSKGVYLVEDVHAMKKLKQELDLSSGSCVQPYIGSPEEEYTVGVLTDKDGELIDSIVIKRELLGLSLLTSKNVGGRRYAVSTGYSQGYVIQHDVIQRFCEKLALDLGSRGPLNIQLRMSEGVPFVFEIHPRFSGTTPIRADVGFNEVDILLRNYLFGEKFSRLHYQFNVAAIRAFEHVIVPIEQMKH
jgi:carbamoyl-phosphate synthase large subunit